MQFGKLFDQILVQHQARRKGIDSLLVFALKLVANLALDGAGVALKHLIINCRFMAQANHTDVAADFREKLPRFDSHSVHRRM